MKHLLICCRVAHGWEDQVCSSSNLVHHPQPAATGQAIQHTKMGISIKQKLANGRKIESKQPNLLLVMKFGFLLEKLPRSRCSPLQQCRVAFLTYIHLLFAIAAHVQNYKGDGKGKNVSPNMLHIFQGSVMLWQHCASSTASPLGIHLRPEMPWKYLWMLSNSHFKRSISSVEGTWGELIGV